jgi:hypothetical protein
VSDMWPWQSNRQCYGRTYPQGAYTGALLLLMAQRVYVCLLAPAAAAADADAPAAAAPSKPSKHSSQATCCIDKQLAQVPAATANSAPA